MKDTDYTDAEKMEAIRLAVKYGILIQNADNQVGPSVKFVQRLISAVENDEIFSGSNPVMRAIIYACVGVAGQISEVQLAPIAIVAKSVLTQTGCPVDG